MDGAYVARMGDEPVAAAHTHGTGDVLLRLARPSYRLARHCPPRTGDELTGHHGHLRGLPVLTVRHDLARRAARGVTRTLLRGGGDDHHADDPRTAVRSEGAGRHRCGDQGVGRTSGEHGACRHGAWYAGYPHCRRCGGRHHRGAPRREPADRRHCCERPHKHRRVDGDRRVDAGGGGGRSQRGRFDGQRQWHDPLPCHPCGIPDRARTDHSARA